MTLVTSPSVSIVRLQKAAGVVLKKPFTLEDGESESEAGCDAFGVSVSNASCDVVSLLTAVRDNWNAICDVSKPIYHTSTQGTVALTVTVSTSLVCIVILRFNLRSLLCKIQMRQLTWWLPWTAQIRPVRGSPNTVV